EASEAELARANQAPGQDAKVTYQATISDANMGAFGAAHCIAEAITNCYPIEEVEAAANAEKLEQSRLIKCIFGNPFNHVVIDPNCLSPAVVEMAHTIYDDRAFDRLSHLADALVDAGCTNVDVLAHCRAHGGHARGCWVVDLILGKK